MTKKYNHKEVEKKIQQKWRESGVFKTDFENDKPKYYLLDMFPYPSGDGLHMGHTEQAAITDAFYRYKRMKGFNVLHPQGFDSFGLPAENYAVKTGIPPAETISKTTKRFKEQMDNLGLAYDFVNNGVITSTPEYYKHTQWLFGKFFENDLVYKKTAKANWCPSCQTIIANEQIENGKCERCKTEIEQKDVPSWMFRITDFADDLIWKMDESDGVDWPEHTKKNQNAWIGKSTGAEIQFSIFNSQFSNNEEIFNDLNKKFTVFTTRPDTLFGATYTVLAPENNLVQELKEYISNWDKVQEYIDKTKKKTELERLEGKEKTGVKLEGVFAKNPANGDLIPIFISDYVLAGYGTGAIMAVPAHDERDFEFAKKFGIPIKPVVLKQTEKSHSFIMGTKNISKESLEKIGVEVVEETEKGFLKVLIPFEKLEEYKEFIRENMENGFWNEFSTKNNFYFIFKHKNGEIEEFELNSETNDKIDEYGWSFNDLEVKKPAENVYSWLLDGGDGFYKEILGSTEYGILVNSGEFDGMDSEEVKEKITEFVGGKMTATYRLRDWSISRQRYWGTPIPMVYDPEGNPHFVGEENLPWLLPTDVDFVPTGEAPLAKSKELKERVERIFGEGWTPEVDTMDTFVDSSWYFLRYPDPNNDKEFASEERLKKWMPVDLYIGGAEHTYMHLLYARFFTHAMNKMGLIDFKEPFKKLRHQGMILDKQGKKMSKSKGNVVNPDEMVERFGADATRAYMLFAGPIEDDKMWNEDNIVGIYRWIEKIWRQQEKLTDEENLDFKKELHKTIKKVSKNIDDLRFNVAIADMMKLMNFADKQEKINRADFLEFVKILSPFVPHVAEEIFEAVGGEGFLVEKEWPTFDEELAKDDLITLAVQVNGKKRGEIQVSPEAEESEVVEKSKADPEISKWFEGDIKKVIYVKGRILNFVV